jgi:hypothetical protein
LISLVLRNVFLWSFSYYLEQNKQQQCKTWKSNFKYIFVHFLCTYTSAQFWLSTIFGNKISSDYWQRVPPMICLHFMMFKNLIEFLKYTLFSLAKNSQDDFILVFVTPDNKELVICKFLVFFKKTEVLLWCGLSYMLKQVGNFSIFPQHQPTTCFTTTSN